MLRFIPLKRSLLDYDQQPEDDGLLLFPTMVSVIVISVKCLDTSFEISLINYSILLYFVLV